MDAPLARALLGKRLDDEVEIPIEGRPRYAVVAIRYGAVEA
jgi:transcription elongation GreA/GreB family factor